MRARQDVDLARDRADVGEPTPVETRPLVDDLLAHHLLGDLLDELLHLLRLVGVGGGERHDRLVLDGVERGVALLLHGLRERGLEPPCRELLYRRDERLVDRQRDDRPLVLADRRAELLLERDQGLRRFVCPEEPFQQDALGKDARAALDHDDRVLARRDDQVEVALGKLRGRGVDHEGACDAPHAHRRDGSVERDVGDGERDRRAEERDHVRVVLLVVGEHRRDHLRLAVEALREERANRPVDQPRRQDLLLRRAAFALEEPAGDLPGGEGLLLVVAGEREEVDALPGRAARRGGHQHDGLAVLDPGGSPRLPGDPPGLDDQTATVEIKLDAFSHASLPAAPGRSLHVWRVVTGGEGGEPDARPYFRKPSRSMTLL